MSLMINTFEEAKIIATSIGGGVTYYKWPKIVHWFIRPCSEDNSSLSPQLTDAQKKKAEIAGFWKTCRHGAIAMFAGSAVFGVNGASMGAIFVIGGSVSRFFPQR